MFKGQTQLNFNGSNRLGQCKISFSQRYFQPFGASFYININSGAPSPIYMTSTIRVCVLLFSFSIFSDRRSLKTENENNSMKT